MDHISPELALVDPDLAAAARQLLPDPGDCLAQRPRLSSVAGREPVLAEALRERSEPVVRRRWPAVAAASAAWAVLAGLVGSSLLAFIPPSESARPLLLTGQGLAGVPKASRLASAGGAVVVRWPYSARAEGYSIVLVGGMRHYDFWSSRSTLAFAQRPSDPTTKRLPPGRYSWSVYPIYRLQGQVSFRPRLASGTITVPTTRAR